MRAQANRNLGIVPESFVIALLRFEFGGGVMSMTSASRKSVPRPDVADQDDPAKQAPGQPQPDADEPDDRTDELDRRHIRQH